MEAEDRLILEKLALGDTPAADLEAFAPNGFFARMEFMLTCKWVIRHEYYPHGQTQPPAYFYRLTEVGRQRLQEPDAAN